MNILKPIALASAIILAACTTDGDAKESEPELPRLEAEYIEGAGILLLAESEEHAKDQVNQWTIPMVLLNGEFHDMADEDGTSKGLRQGDVVILHDAVGENDRMVPAAELYITQVLLPTELSQSANDPWMGKLASEQPPGDGDVDLEEHGCHTCTSSICNTSGFKVRRHREKYFHGWGCKVHGWWAYTCDCY